MVCEERTLEGKTFEQWLDQYLWSSGVQKTLAEEMLDRMVAGDRDE